MNTIWLLIAAFVTDASRTPVIPEPPPPFRDERSCQTAMDLLRLSDLEPFAPAGTTIVAVRTACVPVVVEGEAPRRDAPA